MRQGWSPAAPHALPVCMGSFQHEAYWHAVVPLFVQGEAPSVATQPPPDAPMVYVADVSALGARPSPAQMARSAPERVRVVEALCVEEVVGALPSVVWYGKVPEVGQVIVAVI